MSNDPNVLFSGVIATSTTIYIPIPIRKVNGIAYIGAHVAWKDAVSSATITLELTCYPAAAYTVAGAAWEWEDSALSFSGPAAAAAGSFSINVENVRQKRARLKVVTAAVTALEVLDGTNEDPEVP